MTEERPRASAPKRPEPDRLVEYGLPALMVAFFLLGLAWVFFANNVPWADADFYFRGAKSMADGNGYSHPFTADHAPTAFHPVGYPWLLSHVWQLLRLDTGACDTSAWPAFEGCGAMLQAGQLTNLLLATMNIGLVFALGTLLKNARTGLLAAALYTLIPSRFFYTSALMSEEAFVTAILLALIAVAASVRYPRWFYATAVGFGLAVGAATYIRPLGIVLLVLPLLLVFSHVVTPRRLVVYTLLAAVLAGALILPWEVRNQREMGGPSLLISNNGGINLWIGCHLNSSGNLDASGHWEDWWGANRPASINTSDERFNDEEAQRLAVDCMRAEPFAFARLSLIKGLYTFREDWTYVSKWALNRDLPEDNERPVVSSSVEDALAYLANGVYLLLVPLAAIGGVATFLAPAPHRGLIGVSFALLALIPLAFFGDPRFHVPLFPMMSIWAAEGLAVVWRGLRSEPRFGAIARPQGDAATNVPIEWREEPWPR